MTEQEIDDYTTRNCEYLNMPHHERCRACMVTRWILRSCFGYAEEPEEVMVEDIRHLLAYNRYHKGQTRPRITE